MVDEAVAHLVLSSLFITWVRSGAAGLAGQVEHLQLFITEAGERKLELDLSGELDMATVEPLREAARRSAASGDYDELVIDLAHVQFIDSSGLHALMEAHSAMARAGGRTTIVCTAPHLLEVFELTGLCRLLTIVGDRRQAYAAAA